MVDYDFASGDGTMRIRDTGSVIEFWVQAGYSNFWWDSLDFNFTANGTTYPVAINYPTGAAWYKVGSATVTTTQTVYFRLLQATGTSSLAGPTTVSKAIDRGSIPDPPSAVTLSSITSTSMLATFTDGDNGGLTIDSRQIAYSKTNSTASGLTIVSSDKSTSLTGLSVGTTYYVWARTHNSKGYSGWSSVRSAKTLARPSAPSTVKYANVTQDRVDASFTDGANNGATITGRNLAYSTTNNVSTATVISSDGSTTITGLDAGRLYYFWARTTNSVGTSDWSAVTSVQLLTGAWVNVAGVWKRGVIYVNVAGTWKVGDAWGKNGGYWKPTAQ